MGTRLTMVFLGFALLAPSAWAALHIVNQVGMTFDPPLRVIQEGDTVRWVWSSETHTVTSGPGSGDRNAGSLFDAPLSASNPTFEYTFPVAGSYPYFCRVHELMAMTGTIVVEVPIGVDRSSFGKIKALYEVH